MKSCFFIIQIKLVLNMDFARKQLEKYGWSDGKGLGKHENGISEALKPKLKRSVTGIGHDPASEFNEHWWSALYDKAAKNVEVKEKNGKTKKIKTKDSNNFVITSSTWKINKKPSKQTDEAQYAEYFVRTAVLTNDKSGRKTENVKDESESEVEVTDKKDVLKMTDEELFAACEGRTAHKGARHGLKALGKLARIAQQEQMLLVQPQYEGYSHAKKLKQAVSEHMTAELKVAEKRKKKKRKYGAIEDTESVECEDNPPSEKNKKGDGDATKNENDHNIDSLVPDCNVLEENENNKKKKKNRNKDEQETLVTEPLEIIEASESKVKKRNKKKVRDV